MNNYVEKGEVLTFTAPGTVTSGVLVKINDIVVVPTVNATIGQKFAAMVGPAVITHAKPGSEAWAEGEKVYFDESEGLVTTDDDTAANQLIGVAVAVVGSGSGETTGTLRLDGATR